MSLAATSIHVVINSYVDTTQHARHNNINTANPPKNKADFRSGEKVKAAKRGGSRPGQATVKVEAGVKAKATV